MILGIDLGTTNTVCAILEGGEARVIPTLDGRTLLPSVVTFARTGERIVGDVARRQLVVHPERTLHSAKRFIGRRYKDAANDLGLVQYEVVETRAGECGFRVDGRTFSPAEVSAAVLQRVRQSAEQHLGMPVTRAVITVPAHFDDRRRQATRDAANIAGLEVVRVLNEPTAAALAWLRSRKGAMKACTLAVYDFGGGTFDVSIVRVDGDVAEVRATHGDNALGGSDIDREIEAWLLAEVHADGLDLAEDKVARQRLRDAAEAAKIDLSTMASVDIHLPFLGGTPERPYSLVRTLTRAMLEARIAPFVARTIEACRRALQEAGMVAADIDEVVLAGGSSRIPAVRAAVGACFGRKVELTLNPDDVVALGAALQAGALAGDGDPVTLLDVTSLALGVEVAGGRFATLIPKNTILPAQRTQMVTTASDNQGTVRIHVLQGESPRVADNTSLGQFELSGIAPGDKGAARIEVTFAVDTSGIVNVSAVDTRSGARHAVAIKAPTALRDDERARMAREATEADATARNRRERSTVVAELRSRLPALDIAAAGADFDAAEAEVAAQRIRDALAADLPLQALRDLATWSAQVTR